MTLAAAASEAPVAGTTGELRVGPCANADAWDAFVRETAGACGYHQHAWRRVFERAFGHECHYLAAARGTHIVGVLPLVAFRSALFGRFAVSLPFVNYGGVLANDEAVARALVDEAVAMARVEGWSHVELRHLDRTAPEWPAKRHKVAMWLELPGDGDALWTDLDRKVRNQVRKAEKSALTVEAGGAGLIDDFYTVFACNMRDLGTPVYARRFFETIVETFPADTRVYVVRLGTIPVAASVTIRWRDRVEVPWASSLRAHNDKSPNTLLYWAMLRDAADGGARVFDFGRSTPDEGTFHFKRQWGAVPRALVWEYAGLDGTLPDHSPKNPKFRAAIAAWQRLPVRLATALGPHIVRNIP